MVKTDTYLLNQNKLSKNIGSLSKTINLNTFSQILGRISVIGFGILATIFVRRYLGREIYGDFIFVISVSTMLSTVADFGSHLIGVREISQQTTKEKIIVGNIFFLRLITCSFASLIVLILANIPAFAKNLKAPLVLSSLLIFTLSLKTFLTIIFHTKLKLYYFSLGNFIISFLSAAGALLLVFKKITPDPFWFVANLIFANLLTVIILIPSAFKMLKPIFLIDFKILKRLFKETIPMAGILILFTFYSKIDTIILRHFQGSGSVGIYGLAYKIYENLNVLAAYFMNSILPLLSRLALDVNKRERFKKILQLSLDLLLGFGILANIFVFLGSGLIIKILTGEYLVSEIITLKILSFAVFVSFINHLGGYLIIVLGKQIESLKIAFLALGFNLIANLIFIPHFSFKAAAVNTILTEGIVLFFSWKVIAKKLSWLPKLGGFSKTTTTFIKEKGKIFDNLG